jgi:hypothetical protein
MTDPNAAASVSREPATLLFLIKGASMYSQFANGRAGNDLSAARVQSLMQGASDAALLPHKLRMLDIEAAHRLALHHSYFNPDQPRMPAGHPDGGQWTRDATGRSDQEIASDAVPESTWTRARVMRRRAQVVRVREIAETFEAPRQSQGRLRASQWPGPERMTQSRAFGSSTRNGALSQASMKVWKG